jgi:hypothetical protein
MPRMIPRHSCISANIFEAMKRIMQNTAFWGVSVSGTGTVSDEWYCDYSTTIQHSR